MVHLGPQTCGQSMWSHGAVVSWSCYVKTTTCPMVNCEEDETLQHLLMDCYRTEEVWSLLRGIGLEFNIKYSSIMYCILDEKMDIKNRELCRLVICITCMQIWKTRCKMILNQTIINRDTIVKQILTELRRRRSLDKSETQPWGILSL